MRIAFCVNEAQLTALCARGSWGLRFQIPAVTVRDLHRFTHAGAMRVIPIEES